jgi:ABC-type uncharacterized transport system substrate-binding protein
LGSLQTTHATDFGPDLEFLGPGSSMLGGSDDLYAAELVALGPECLMADSSMSVLALRRETSTIPIVFVGVTDPVGQRLVQSLARPGGNNTVIQHPTGTPSRGRRSD